MIVLKATQSNVLEALQHYVDVIRERLCSSGGELIPRVLSLPVLTGGGWFAANLRLVRTGAFNPGRHLSGFFSPSKANLRNAP